MILITGGAGYIGSHINKTMNKAGYETLIVDNLINGYEEAIQWGFFEEADLKDYKTLTKIFQQNDIEGVIHCAAFISVAESVKNPVMYLKNNYQNTLNLIRVMKENKVDKFIFSSTAALYGIPETIPIKENTPLKPINPYGQSKLLVEKMLKREADEANIKYTSLRYFNAAGADPETQIGENHQPETHLIPLVLDTAIGKRTTISIFGDDYDTPDGTCIRDYIHVCDLAQAHLLAYKYLEENNESKIYNLGNGEGFSVKEVIETCKKVTKAPIPTLIESRREGDPARLVADSTKIKEELKWKPKYPKLEQIVETAWKWHQKLNKTELQ